MWFAKMVQVHSLNFERDDFTSGNRGVKVDASTAFIR
jgi:hypothetical protein